VLPLNFDPVDAGRQHVERRWGGSAASGAAALSVMRVNEILMEEVNTMLAPFGLNLSRYETLMLLSRGNGGLQLRLIGEHLQVQAASVTNIVDRLEADGFVRREPLAEDRRVHLASITRLGRRVAAQATAALERGTLALDALREDELEQIVGLLRKARIRAGDFGNVTILPEQ
jgi:DNA-binding MarR family transcriptional regulator